MKELWLKEFQEQYKKAYELEKTIKPIPVEPPPGAKYAVYK